MATDSVQKQTAQNQATETSTAAADTGNRAGSDVLTNNGASLSIQRIMTLVVTLFIVVAAMIWGLYVVHPDDPYVDSVLELTGDTRRGREIFKLNCATCHGLEAAGEVGPDLRAVSERKSRAALIKQVTSGQTPPMPQFQPKEKDMADLLSFLETL